MFRLIPGSSSDLRDGSSSVRSGGSSQQGTTSRNNSNLSRANASQPAALGGSPDIPPSIVYNFPSCPGPCPSGRWAHSTCAMGHLLVVYGGIGTILYDDLWTLDTETLAWRSLSPKAASSKDMPETAMGHAAAALGSRMWLFGGQQGRSLLRKLHVLDLEAMTWRRLSRGSDTLPCARAGHAMVSVPGAIYLFGGQGKKLLNDLHRMDPETGLFYEVKASGRLPLPRRGMSLVYDGRDSLICFGGAHAGGADAALHVYSLSRAEWHSPVHQGNAPAARTNHSAVLLAPHQVLIFGGCNTQGNFFNDAHILDTRTFTWYAPQPLNAAPAPRYHHSCCAVAGRAYIYGGINSKQTFDGVVVMDTRYDTEISHIAEELRVLSSVRDASVASDRTSNSGTSIASAAPSGAPSGAASGAVSASVDIMKVQLMDLLYKRNMEELHAHAAQKTEAVEQQLAREREASEALRRENLQLKILVAEAEEAAAGAAERARVAAAQAGRGGAALAELRTNLEARDRSLAERQAELEAAKRLHQGLVKELGLVASRHAKLQQQHRHKACGRSLAMQAGGSAGGGGGSGAAVEEFARAHHRLVGHSEPLQQALFEQGLVQGEERATGYEGGGSGAAGGGTVAGSGASSPDYPVLAHFEDVLTQLAEAEQAREEAAGQLAAAQARAAAAEAEGAALRAELSAARGDRAALQALSLEELRRVEEQLEGALRAARDVVVARRMAEVERAASEQQSCSLCLEAPRGVVFNCGHQSCAGCSEKLPSCPFCRTPITARIKLFNS